MIDLIVVAVVCICVGMSLGIQIGVCIGRKQAIENPKKEVFS